MNIFQKKKSSEKNTFAINDWLLGFSAISFLLLYLLLSFYNRPFYDDFQCIDLIKKNSLLKFLTYWYTTWSGRWTAMTYFYFTTKYNTDFLSIHYYFFIYYCLTIFILIYSINNIIRFGFHKIFNVTIDLKTSLIYSILFIACFYFSTFQNIEAWWWMSASYIYIQGIAFFLLGFSLLIKEKKNILHYLLIFFCFIYVGGSYEIYSMIIISLFLLALIYFLFIQPNKYPKFKNSYFFKGFIIAFLSLTVAAFISFNAPGNMIRMNKTAQSTISASYSSKQNFSAFDLNIFAQKKYGIAILLSSCWLLLGMKLKNKISFSNENKKGLKKTLFLFSLPLLISVLITCFFQFIILDHHSLPLRSWTFTSFSLAAFLCFFFFAIGITIDFSNALQNLLKICIPALTLFLLTFTVYKQYQLVNPYSQKYDQLMSALIDATKKPETDSLIVKKLPDSGMLMQLYIGDTYTDDQLIELLGIKYKIIAVD